MPSPERSAARRIYEDAITQFSEASGVLYRRSLEGTSATAEEIECYAAAQVRLEVARRLYHETLWQLF
jgi:hypothetical protein